LWKTRLAKFPKSAWKNLKSRSATFLFRSAELQTRTVSFHPPRLSKIRVEEFKIRSATFQFRGAELQTRIASFHPPRLGSPSLAPLSSQLILLVLPCSHYLYSFWMIFLMQTNPLDIFLHFATMQSSCDVHAVKKLASTAQGQ
jgi:hypothetical protein